ncbi:MAG: YybH family protein [Planctomycetaceae bacterium]
MCQGIRVASLFVALSLGLGWIVFAQNKKAAEPARPAAPAKPAGQSPEKKKDGKPAPPQDATAARDAEDEKVIRASAEAFAKAYNAKDAKGLAALFALKAEFIEEDGTLTKGREEIEKSFAEMFAEHPRATIAVEPDSVRILTPNIAVEDGVVRGIPEPDGPENVSTYVAVHVKVDNKWLVASVRDFDAEPEDPTPHDHLRELDWLIGEWIDESPTACVHARYDWAENGNFLLQTFHVQAGDQITMSGNMRIGWDPLAKQFKSWVFDSDGGYLEGWWIRSGDEWIVKSHGVTGDGDTASSTNVYRLIDYDTVGWRSYERIVGGELQDDIDEIVVKRKPPPPQF